MIQSRKLFAKLATFFVLTASPAALAQQGYGQIVLENNMSVTVDLWVDGNYGCRALAHLTCVTQALTGYHALKAVATDGRSLDQILENLQQGEVYTFRVWEG
jgi:hypothetical protein